ncbi:Thiol-disulfide isomerase or thioredoxin [Agromyces sp. CF514]|uniref:TlpA family protein disulfide reductase n=1 Tax=Agromyces sp. CF514 TaxID=1881031 RepID=UPI0008EF3801|nr:thioredoxin family protein [Agromyces sp. CF514]SFR88520.1 Thiol-disulfide isomerase or thioredoxin [Agromyces sp. CF514]
MDWQAALIAGLGLPALATVVGLAWKARTGRVRAVPASAGQATGPVVANAAAAAARSSSAAALGLVDADLGADATLVQFSTEYCSRCPATARQLGEIADDYAGVRHVEIDLTHRADLADRFHVRQTPTTLILRADGTTTARIGGVPRLAAVRTQLETLIGSPHVAS